MVRPRIAIISAEDTRSRLVLSGTPYYMARALQQHCGDVVHLGPATAPIELLAKVRNRVARTLLGRAAPYQHAPGVARRHAGIFRKRLAAAGRIDVIFAPMASTEIAELETDLPIVYTSDATFALMRDYYPGFSRLGEVYAAGGNAIEHAALHRSAAAVFPSEWAARSARESYGLDPERIQVVPYGANLDEIPDRASVLAAKRDACALLFLGLDWERKGGAIAFAATHRLRERGIEATLTVCGCVPPAEYRAPWLRVVPRLDKTVAADRRALSRLLLEATFLILPTRQECYGVVFCEAAAHGTPSIATRTGGTGAAVADGRSGVLLPPEADADSYAGAIASIVSDGAAYASLVAASRAHYEGCVNWDVWGRRMAAILAQVLG